MAAASATAPHDEWEWFADFGRDRYTIYNEGGWYAARWRTKHPGQPLRYAECWGLQDAGGSQGRVRARCAAECQLARITTITTRRITHAPLVNWGQYAPANLWFLGLVEKLCELFSPAGF